MKFNFLGDISEVKAGLDILAPDYGFEICECGIPTTVTKGEMLRVCFDGKEAAIEYSRPSEFFRALGFLLAETDNGKKAFKKAHCRH